MSVGGGGGRRDKRLRVVKALTMHVGLTGVHWESTGRLEVPDYPGIDGFLGLPILKARQMLREQSPQHINAVIHHTRGDASVMEAVMLVPLRSGLLLLDSYHKTHNQLEV